jgi:hypothetical protein
MNKPGGKQITLPKPTVETVGYFRSPLCGYADKISRWNESSRAGVLECGGKRSATPL